MARSMSTGCRGPPRRRAAPPLLLLLASLLLAGARQASGEVAMVWLVTRHGARNVLPKSSLLQETDAAGGPTLLPKGVNASVNAGAAFRARYLDHATCERTMTCISADGSEGYGLPGEPGAGFSNYDTLARSSGLDRTLKSAAAFLSGAFPSAGPSSGGDGGGAQLPPVYSSPDDDDYVIRGYTKCPAYERRLEAWYASPEFVAKEADTKDLRDQIKAAAPNLDTNLTNWWNVYDAFNVWRKNGLGEPMPNITDDQFQQVTAIADWLETAKMRSDLAGGSLGGPLLADLLSRLQDAAAALSQTPPAHYYRLLLTSAHYNTQLGLLSAMALDKHLTPASLPWLATIPATSSVLMFELHASDGTLSNGTSAPPPAAPLFAVRMLIQDGPGSGYAPVPLPCAASVAADGSTDPAEALAGPGACELGAFLRAFAGGAVGGAGAWCGVCDNRQMDACIAFAARHGGGQGAAQQAPGGGGGGGGAAWKVAVAVVASVVGTAALAAGAFALLRRRERRAWQKFESPEGPQIGLAALPPAGGADAALKDHSALPL